MPVAAAAVASLDTDAADPARAPADVAAAASLGADVAAGEKEPVSMPAPPEAKPIRDVAVDTGHSGTERHAALQSGRVAVLLPVDGSAPVSW